VENTSVQGGIPPAEIVGEDKEDIGLARCGFGGLCPNGKQRNNKSGSGDFQKITTRNSAHGFTSEISSSDGAR
jgi:hypothetical protein